MSKTIITHYLLQLLHILNAEIRLWWTKIINMCLWILQVVSCVLLILSETMVLWFHFVTQHGGAKIDRCHVRLKKSFMLASWCSAFFRFTWELSIQCQQCRTISLFYFILECRICILMQSHRDLLHQEVHCQSLEIYVLRDFSRRTQYWMGESSRVWGPRGILINHIIFKIFTESHIFS